MASNKVVLNRRQALGLIATSAIAVPVLGSATGVAVERNSAVQPLATLKDPNLLHPEYPWALLLNTEEVATLSVLCDMIIPADAEGPAASALGAQDYINEHVSAPYDDNRADLIVVRGGLVWLDGESERRFGNLFTVLKTVQKESICNDIHWAETAKPEFQYASKFFGLVRNMTAAAYFTTRQGMAYVGYVGNTPMQSFPAPPVAVLKKLGLVS